MARVEQDESSNRLPADRQEAPRLPACAVCCYCPGEVGRSDLGCRVSVSVLRNDYMSLTGQ